MNLKFQKNETELTVSLSGALNSVSSQELSAFLNAELPGIQLLTLDFTDCDFVSSAGLRILLAAYKRMKQENGTMRLIHVGTEFMDILKKTGLDAVFEIQ